MMPYTIGLQVGDAYSVAVALPSDGPPIVVAAPSIIGRAEGRMLVPAMSRDVGDVAWWGGWGALGSARPHLITGLDRMYDPIFLPVMGGHLIHLLAECIPAHEVEQAPWVAGLPARWGVDEGRAKALGERLRTAGTGLESLTVMNNPEAVGFAGLLTDRGERTSDLRGKHDLLVVEVGSEAIEVAHLHRGRMTRVISSPYGIAHSLQPLRMELQEHVGPLPFCALVAALSDVPAVGAGGPETLHALREHLPAQWQPDLARWADTMSGLIMEQCASLSGNVEEPLPIILGGEGLMVAPVREQLTRILAVHTVLPWYSMALGLARYGAYTTRRTPQPGGSA